MSAATILIVLATVVSVEGDRALIDRGLVHGLEPGDPGSLFYELTVNGMPKRIEVGQGEVVSVTEEVAKLAGAPGLTLRPGYLVELRIPGERLAPENLLPRARRHLDEARYRAVAADLAAVFAGDEVGEKEATAAPPPVSPAPGQESGGSAASMPGKDPLQNMIRVPAGRYAVGLDPQEAEFYNQQPRFERALAEFWIDEHPVAPPDGATLDPPAGEYLSELSWRQASEHCRALGKRLPTEFEWEIAAQLTQVRLAPGLLEWTASWYQPYPGNSHPEPKYGETFRVLRGSVEGEKISPHTRRFMQPELGSPRVGFRCARSAE
jgi:pyruvate/2-oxoglutarate dehydrogenase complex dihydrolipoamide acyltransferase (E2) component